jgi:hypothetical protein
LFRISPWVDWLQPTSCKLFFHRQHRTTYLRRSLNPSTIFRHNYCSPKISKSYFDSGQIVSVFGIRVFQGRRAFHSVVFLIRVMLEDKFVPEIKERQESHNYPLRNRSFFSEMLERERFGLIVVIFTFVVVLICLKTTSWATSPSGFQYGNTIL